MRLDQWLFERGDFASRSKARDAIIRGCVLIHGKTMTKPGYKIEKDSTVEICDPAQNLVSRGGLKLQAALDHFAIRVQGRTCLDIGVSTGGFSQVLLNRGAAHIIAVDVGHGQLHPHLVTDERIILHEGLNARHLELHHFGVYQPDLLVCDVSFISLKLALPPALTFMRMGSEAILLIKPQFEAGRAALNGQGIVKNPAMGAQIAQDLSDWLDTMIGWRSCGFLPSPIVGGDGNQEFLLYGIKDNG